MVRLEGVSFRYPGAAQEALCGVDLHVEAGECVLVAGRSGCGKSTLLYVLNGLIPHLFNGDLAGTVAVGDMAPGQVPLQELSRRVGTVFQNPDNQLFMLTVADDVAFGCENLLLPPAEIRARVARVLAQVGLEALRERPLAALSGGQKQRCALAGVLAMAPEILVLDEPTADLDGQGTEEVFAELGRLRRQGKTIVLVEHKLEEASQLADRIVVMEAGRVVADGPPRQVLGSRQLWLDDLDLPDVIRLDLTPPPLTADEAIALLRQRGGPQRLLPATDGWKPVSRTRAAPVIRVRELRFAYAAEEVLKGVSFEIHQGEMVAVIGANGSGKTTLFRILMGLEQAEAGEVVVAGIADPHLGDLVGRVGYLFQNPDEQLFCDTARQEVSFGPAQLGVQADADAYLELASLSWGADRHPHTLSRGERQRLALVSLLAMAPEILVLDEPTTGQDRSNWRHSLELARRLAKEGKTIIFSTHNMKVVGEYADRVLLLSRGTLVADGSPRAVLGADLRQHGLQTPQLVELSRRLGRVCLTWQELAQGLQDGAVPC